MYNVGDDFTLLNSSTFYSFFMVNRIDIPRCFKPIHSLKRPINEIDILKISNFFSKNGKRHSTLKSINLSMYGLWSDLNNLKMYKHTNFSNWKDFYNLYATIYITPTSKNIFKINNNEVVSYDNIITPFYKDILTTWDNKKILFQNIYKLLPIFSFYIYKVDKQIFKNTRGRSGKYTFIWKYVAPYKRKLLVMFWLLKELRISQGRTFLNRLTSVLKVLIFSPEKTWAFRVKKFSVNYVYKNCRNTLAEHYRTTTK